MKTVDELKAALKNPRISMTVNSQVKKIFSLGPHDYLGYADKDLKSKDSRATVNAVGNVTRALSSRADEALAAWGYLAMVEREGYDLNQKLELLRKIGAVSPLILKRIHSFRLAAEKDFEEMSFEAAVDYYSVVDFFVRYSDRLLAAGEIIVTDESHADNSVTIAVDGEAKTIRVTYLLHDPKDETAKPQSGVIKVALTANSFDQYTQTLKWWLGLLEN